MSETQNAQTATEMPSTEEIGAMVAAGVGQLLVGIPFTIGARKIIRRVTQHIKPEDLSMKDKILWNVGELGLATVIGQTVGKSVQSATNELFDAGTHIATIVNVIKASSANGTEKTEPTPIKGEVVTD